MMGETQHAFATEDPGSGAQDKEVSFEPFGKKEVAEFDTKLLDAGAENGSGFTPVKEKESHNQREAVIRPQQTGKIDFKSLQNRPRFPNEGPWGAVKGSPQSPTGKSRGKEKNKRAGKGERGHQQLYRLTVSSARPTPTIGIAYPQQKVTPPKKVEAVGRGGHLSESYRFHVPSLPEREGELQQEELGFARGFSEGPSSHISSNYTSPTKIQAPVGTPHENHSTNGHYLEFQGNGNSAWSSAEKVLSGVNGGVLPPKTCPFPESGKASAHCLGPLSFQYPFQTLHSSATDPFQGDVRAQDYADVSVVSHGAFAFHSSSRDWKEEALGNGDGVALESRAYGLAAPPLPQFLPPQTNGPLPSYKGRHEHSTDHNGAISPSGAIDPNPSTFPENPAIFPPSLHLSSMPKPLGTRQPLSKDSVASPRILDPGSALRRNTPHVSPPRVHFQNKAYGDPTANGVGSLPFDKSLSTSLQTHPRHLQPWEGVKKTYSSVEPGSTMYLSSASSPLAFGCHEPRLKKTWQHLHLTSATPNQNRIELSRKLASQKLPFPTLEWDGKGQKSPTDYVTKALQSGEGVVIPRHDLLPQPCNSANAFCFEGAKDSELPAVYGSRSAKSVFFSVSQGMPSSASSRLPSIPGLVLPPSTLAASPSESPLPSPAPNATSSSSTCSSLSPTSSSPNSFEEGFALNPSSFFHHQCGAKEGNKPFQALEPPSCGTFPFSPEASKDELLYKSISADGHFPKPSLEAFKGCLDVFESELPPPPYSSSHHLLASSLSSASLDQLDVFLTCKQCDQNFSNLSSFLEHRQFCSSHAALHQSQAKDPSRGPEARKQHHGVPEPIKHTQAGLGLLLLPPQDPHTHLLALNKGDDFLIDGEVKGDAKDDPLKGNQLNGVAPNPLPLSASDLEIDDAKLDSLITEALNGLGYQSDNPEIDSSFIDVFADEELAHGGAPSKTKEGFSSGQKAKQVEENVKTLSCYEDHPVGDPAKGRISGHQEQSEAWLPVDGGESPELASSRFMDLAKLNGEDADAPLKIRRKNCSRSFVPMKPAAKAMPDVKRSKARGSSAGSEPRPAATSITKDTKKQKLRSNTWSKELIHKIVEQKNKLHKLHTKSSKVAPLVCAPDRLLPETKDSKFVEYEYFSESDEERVEYAKRHCRRKLGSRFKGRLRSSFSRKRQGRGGREKEKESAWRYGLKRDRGEEPQKTASKEPARGEGGMDRARRRSSRSSSSSCQATSLTSETSDSPQSTEKADSDTENEEQKRVLQNSKQRELLDVPEKEAVGRSRRMSIDLSRDLDGVDSAKLQLADVKAYQRDVSAIALNEEEGLLQIQGKLPSSQAIHGKGSAMLFSPEATEECIKGTRHDSDEPMRKDREQRRLQGAPRCPPFPAYNGETLKYHTEEFLSPSSVGTQSLPNDENASYEQVDVKCLKKQKEFIASLSCFNGNSCDAGTVGKGGPKMLVNAAETFYSCKELPDSYESSGLFSQPPAAESSQNSNAYFCHGDIAFKQKQHEILPYEAENEEGKMSSPLSFDSSSVFVAEFDTTLYDGMASSKDSYAPFECAGHPLGKMDQHYPSFLHEKDWNLMEDISPVLPDEISPFHGLSVEKPITKQYLSELHQTPLPERITDYNVVPFISSISDDELEIKRLVTELESQLQTSKLHMEEAPGEEPAISKDHPGTERSETGHQFLPLTLDQESDDKGLFLMEEEFGGANLVPANTCSCETSESEKTLLSSLDGKYGSHENPWDHSVPFGPLHLAPSAPELILVEPLSSKENQDKMHEDLKNSEICGGNGFHDIRDASGQIMPDPSLPDISMEVPSYTSDLMQSPEAFFPKTLVTLPPRTDAFPELLPKEETFNGVAKLGSYQVPGSTSESELISGQEAEGDSLSGVQSIEEPDEMRSSFPKTNSPKTLDVTACFQNSQDDPVLPEKVTESEKTQSVCQSPAVPSKANDGESSPSEALAHSKETNEKVVEYEPALQEKADNPLQQLQLFVARTVKNNEEDLLAPCFSILHPTTHLLPSTYIQARQKEELKDNMPSEEVTGGPVVDKRKRSLGEEPESVAKGSDPSELVLEQGKLMEHLSQRIPYATTEAVTQSPERDFAEGERQQKEQRLKDERSEEGDINTCADGISPEHNNLSPLGNRGAASSLREEGAQGGRVTGEMEEDREKATLAFRNHKSPGSLEKETLGCALAAVLTGRSPSWDQACGKGQGKALQTERDGEEPPEGQLSTELPEFEDNCLQHGTKFCSESTPVSAEGHGLKKCASPHGNARLDCFSSTAGLMNPKDLQRNNMGNMTFNDSDMPPSEEVHSKIPACKYSSNAGDPMQREQNGAPPLTIEHYGATSPQALQPCHAKDTTLDSPGSQKGTSVPSISSPGSIDLASLIETERAMELHMDDYNPPHVLPLKNKDLPCSEEVPKHQEDSETCPLGDAIIPAQSSSQQVVAFGQPQSKVDSALPLDSKTKENTEFVLKPQGKKEDKTYLQADQTQPEVNKADIQEVSIVCIPETTNENGGHFNEGQILETEENGSQNALQGIDNGGHGLEKEDCKPTANAEEPSGFVEKEKNKGGRLGDTSKTGSETTKERKGSPATCDICSASFRSKTGLMRHKAMKHLSKTEDALLPALFPLEKEFKMSKKNRKLPIKEKACNSPLAKAATGQPFPKSYRNQRRKPKREAQGVVSKVFSDLNGTSSGSSCELQSTGSPSKEREGELAPRKEENAGGKEREARTDKLDSFSGKKVKGKARKVKAKGVRNQKTLTQNSQLKIDIPALGFDVVPSTTDLILTTTTINKGLENSPISTEHSTSLPYPSRVKEFEAVDERTSSAKETTEENLLQDVEDTKEQAEDPDGKQCMEESCPSGSTKESEEESSPCEGTSVKELKTKENLLEEMMDRNPNSPLGRALNGPQQPCRVGATEKDFPKEASGAGDPCLEDPQSWRTEEFPPKDEPQDRSGAGPDLFDDDTTFSQLFPRNDQFARRKCRRVYGKRIKKPKPVAEVATRPEATADLFSIRMASDLGETSSFCVTREDPCEYDTISIDDALMLNMCHGSKPMLGDVTSGSTKRTVGLRDEVTESENAGTLSLLCQKSPTNDLPSLGTWTSLEKKGDNIPAHEESLNPSMELTDGHLTVGDSPEPPDLEEEPYETRTNENPCSPALHTIDTETLNAKFETREVCLYSVGEDNLGCTDNECTLGFKPASVLQGRPSKNKLEEGKQGKSRSDLNLKTKDKQYKCKVCFQWFLTLGELDFHKLSHNPSPPPTCYMCVQRKFSSREQLRDHLKEKHAKNKAGLWACGMCLKEISDVWMYNEHLREHATQFARKGQAQKSVLGLPGCFSEEDPAVTQFLNSIMCRKPSKVSKNPKVQTCKERKAPKEPLEQEAATVNKDSLETPCRVKPPVASPKVPTAPSPDPAPKVEVAQKLAPMHPECKDPSRDCHHCGKQFPKPFKLQRHLVVHSLQKIYLCHKCPMFYQETKELRSHLSQEHGAVEEADIKHTTLYACELCADVMHVIKKSFICSTCNYTFSKKEQYDRHMEKHLVGSSRTFRFRGVMRPGASVKERDKAAKEEAPPKEEVPVAKKKRVGHHNSSLAPGSPLHCTQDLQLEGEPLPPLGPLSRHHSSTTSLPETSMKTEGLLGDFSNLLTETKKFLFDSLPPDTSLVPQDEQSSPERLGHVSSLSEGQQTKRDNITDDLSPSFESSDAVRLDLTSSAHKKTAAAQKLSHLPEKRSKEPAEKVTLSAEDATGTWENLREGDPSVSKKAMGFSPAIDCKKEPKTRSHVSMNPNEAQPQESVVKTHLPEAAFQMLPLKDKIVSPIQNQSSSKKVPLGENPSGLQCPLDEEDEGQKPPSSKDKAARETPAAHSRDNCPNVGIKEAGNKAAGGHLRSEVPKLGHSDLSKCQERLAKLHPKKRKEHKATHKASSRENIEGDGGKKKKARTQDNGGGDGDLKRPDWPNSEGLALTSRRGDAHCNKLSLKLKVPLAGGQLKKTVLEPCFQKKANGDVKRKKDILGSKAFHPLLGKDPSGHHFHRQRAIQGAKLSDSHNYRTAESQNNLLSQLFGQKLTSFKIPLRRDPSE